jgi:hypothetical protein
VLKHCAVNRKRQISALLDVGAYIYAFKISGFTRSSIYIYDISRLRVKQGFIKVGSFLSHWAGFLNNN